jgi:hypothetical protein
MSFIKKSAYKSEAPIWMLMAPADVVPSIQNDTTIPIWNSLPIDQKPGLILAFVQSESDVLDALQQIKPLFEPDMHLWMAYPKGSSKRYKSSMNRDKGWNALGAWGMEPVRQIAIDDDWSALRFRPIDQIKSFTRRSSMALSSEGKLRGKK